MQEEHSIITECPGCETRFRVSQGQLKIADGQVRCGHCLLVFSALACQPAKTISTQGSSISSPSTSAPNSDCAIPGSEPFAMAAEIDQTPTAAAQVNEAAQIQEQPDSVATNSHCDRDTAAAVSESTQTHRSATYTGNKAPTLTIHPEPISLNASQHNRPFSWRWLLACAFALSGLAAQFLWFERANLYWQPHLQPLYQQFCLHVDCQLPHRNRIDLISSEQFLLRDHSDIEGALTMEIILTNQAGFSQPYPALQLSFADLKGRLVAERIFQPHTYLNSNTRQNAMMPVDQPVLISLEIMSPGARAVSYELNLLAPET